MSESVSTHKRRKRQLRSELVSQTFGCWKVVRVGIAHCVIVQCGCGNEQEVKQYQLKIGKCASCPCQWSLPAPPMPEGARAVPEFPDYCVAPDAIVYSRRVYGSIMRRLGDWWAMKPKGTSNPKRYQHVDLFNEIGAPVRFSLHILVASVFIGPCPDGKIVCHKDDDRRRNGVENLYYGTNVSNYADSVRNGIANIGESRFNATLTNEQVREIRALVATGMPYKEIANRFGKREHYIARIACREIWKHV